MDVTAIREKYYELLPALSSFVKRLAKYELDECELDKVKEAVAQMKQRVKALEELLQ